MFRGTGRLTSRSKRTWAIWVCICICIWTAGWLIAELIPVCLASMTQNLRSTYGVSTQFFSDLLSIISSILTVWFTYGLSGVLWIHDHSNKGPEGVAHGGVGFFGSRRARTEMALSVFVVRASLFKCGARILNIFLDFLLDGHHGSRHVLGY